MSIVLDTREGDLKLSRVAFQSMATYLASMVADLGNLDTLKFGGVAAADRSPFVAHNTTDISSDTAQEIKAAVASKKHWITRVVLANKTAGETPIVKIQDDTAETPVDFLVVRMGGLADASSLVVIECDPPIEVGAGKAINGVATSATGDVIATVFGWVED